MLEALNPVQLPHTASSQANFSCKMLLKRRNDTQNGVTVTKKCFVDPVESCHALTSP